MPMSHRAVIFDLDGTLVDSAPSLHRAACAMLRGLNLPEPDLRTVTGFVGNGVPTLVDRCLDWAGGPSTDAALALFRQIYDADPVTGVAIFDGVSALLADLAGRGVQLGLCTNKPTAPTETLLRKLDLGPFAAVACGDTLPVRKPHPDPLLHVIDALNVPVGDVLYVGDSVVDLQTARAAGVEYAHIALGYQNGTLTGLPQSQVHPDIGSLSRKLLGS